MECNIYSVKAEHTVVAGVLIEGSQDPNFLHIPVLNARM
jgi:hypothetical protein